MFFVLKQHVELGRTFDNNVRIGGFKTIKGAFNACLKHSPAIVRDEHRQIWAQTVDHAAPRYIDSQAIYR